MERIVIFGGGLHANVCIDILEKYSDYLIVGIVDSKYEIGSELYGYKVIGRQENISDLVNEFKITAGFISIGENYSRKYVYDFITNILPDFNFINAIHPNSCISKNVKIGIGTVIMSGAIVNPNCNVGDFCILNTGAQLEHDSSIGSFSHLSCGVITGGKVTIGKYCWIAVGATIIDRITIGNNSLVGAGTVVVKDFGDNLVVYGNPAKYKRTRKEGEGYLK